MSLLRLYAFMTGQLYVLIDKLIETNFYRHVGSSDDSKLKVMKVLSRA
jgi:hypothetical protein